MTITYIMCALLACCVSPGLLLMPRPAPLDPTVFNHFTKSGGSSLKKQLAQSCKGGLTRRPGALRNESPYG